MGKFWGQRAVKEMLKNLGYVGRVMATEVTWSFDNGWHPHFHILMFFEHELFNGGQGLRTFLANEWINACRKAGLKLPTLEHGVDLQDGSYADQYVTKWGLESEITKGHLKKVVKIVLPHLICLGNLLRCLCMGFCLENLPTCSKVKSSCIGLKG